MSRETREFVQSLRNGQDNQGPQINWTRGFNGEGDNDNDSSNNSYQYQRSGADESNSQSSNTHWDDDTEASGWW
jgi:hypothetical protein